MTIAKKDLNLADRTQCCTAYFYDRDTYRLYQFSAACAAGDWSGFYSDLAGLLRYSDDCGETVNFERFVCALALDKFSPRVAAM